MGLAVQPEIRQLKLREQQLATRRFKASDVLVKSVIHYCGRASHDPIPHEITSWPQNEHCDTQSQQRSLKRPEDGWVNPVQPVGIVLSTDQYVPVESAPAFRMFTSN